MPAAAPSSSLECQPIAIGCEISARYVPAPPSSFIASIIWTPSPCVYRPTLSPAGFPFRSRFARRIGDKRDTHLLNTQQYSTPLASSAINGKWLITSIGVMLLANNNRPFSPFRRALTTSLTPRLSWRALEAFLVVRNSFFWSLRWASGWAMGEMASAGT